MVGGRSGWFGLGAAGRLGYAGGSTGYTPVLRGDPAAKPNFPAADFCFCLGGAWRITTEIWDKSLNRAGVREGIRPHRKRNTQKSAKQNSSQKWVYAGYTRAYAQGIREVYARVTRP